MERASNNNNSIKLSNMLQKALSVGHSATPFSPARDFRHHRTVSTANRGYFFSSPITPLVPKAARARRRRNKYDGVLAEPTSPKVSCIGQIKLANKPKFPEIKNRSGSKNLKTTTSSLSSLLVKEEEDKGSFSKLKRFFSFSTGRNPSRKSALAAGREHPIAAVEAVSAPSLGKMKKFASSREAFGGFDWTVKMKPEEAVMIPCSVSTPLTQLEGLSLCPKPKSEVNLWKRRTMDRPKPLQVRDTY